MKPMAWIAGFVILISSVSFAQAQGIRGFGGAMRGSGPPAQSGTFAGPVPQGPAVTQGFTTSRPNFANPTITIPGVPQIATRQFAPRQFRRGGVFVPPLSAIRVSPFVLGVAPHHLHNPWFFRRHRGVLFIDVPSVFGSTIITEVAPGIVESDRRFAEGSPSDARTRGPGQVAPFDPAPQEIVERMLSLAGVKKDDVVYDLGSGDGRIVIAAAKKYGVRAVGFEIDPGLVKLARENARRAGVNKLVEIRQQDFLTADLSPASVVTLYLSYDGNLAVRPQLMRQLKPDTRVVSYTFDMGEWQPKVAETFRDSEGNSHQLYLWQVGQPMVFSDNSPEILQQQPTRDGPLIIEVK
jgi:protein-L-isoaspartate O-methyltransferase